MHFQALTVGLEFPAPQIGETTEAFQLRWDEYLVGLNAAGLSLFHDFLRVAGL